MLLYLYVSRGYWEQNFDFFTFNNVTAKLPTEIEHKIIQEAKFKIPLSRSYIPGKMNCNLSKFYYWTQTKYVPCQKDKLEGTFPKKEMLLFLVSHIIKITLVCTQKGAKVQVWVPICTSDHASVFHIVLRRWRGALYIGQNILTNVRPSWPI